MKFFAVILTLASLAAAAPIADLEARVGGAVTKTTSSAAPSNTADCWYGTCGDSGSGGWKRDEEHDLEARVGGAVTKTTTSTAPASTNTADCWYGTCGDSGSGGWKRLLSLFDSRNNEPEQLEARVGGAVTKTTSTAPAASNTADCWYGTCGNSGGGGW